MNYEIKEILEELKEKNETYKECSGNGIIENEYYKSHILLDYITNLQQENERLNNMLDKADNKNLSLIEEINDKQDIIDKAIEYNYELQERYCHGAIFDELVASKIYEITEKELNILQNGSDTSVK